MCRSTPCPFINDSVSHFASFISLLDLSRRSSNVYISLVFNRFHRERDQNEDQRNMTAPLADQEDSGDIHPHLWTSAGLSLAATAAASSVMPRLTMPKKVSISSKHTFTPHSSLDHPSSADLKHGVRRKAF
jgi:hypothetical protein